MRVLVIVFALLMLVSCGQQPTTDGNTTSVTPLDTLTPLNQEPPSTTDKSAAFRPGLMHREAVGSYTGLFEAVDYDENTDFVYANKITVVMDSFNTTTAFGHSVVAGNLRAFSGKYTQKGKLLAVEGREPGDDRYDGVFSFEIDADAGVLKGIWMANNRKLPVSKRSYELKSRRFAYDPSLELPEDVLWDVLYEKHDEYAEEGEFLTQDVLKLNASKQLLKKEDIENLYKGDLEVIRNTIYARHGYSFKNRKMRFIFDRYVAWYMPVSTDIRADLTPLEKKNMDLLKRYEEHAERYYDVFGR